ncbi:MAG: GMC oxidoreductase [Caldilineales bacterium]
MHDVLIIGAGAAAAAAAFELAQRGIRPLMLDAGAVDDNPTPRVEGNLYDFRRHHDSFDLHIGADYRGLAHLVSAEPAIAKLQAPHMAYVTRDAEVLGPLSQQNFAAIQSFALGGLGNAWGAGLYRWIAADLHDFPLTLTELEPYFDKLTAEIGINGAEDDLAEFFGNPAGLQPPLTLSHNAQQVWQAYQHHRTSLRRRGIALGRPRTGVLSRAHDGRPACDYSNLEFWQAQPYVFTPAQMLRKLNAAGQLNYYGDMLALRWQEHADHVTVTARRLDGGREAQFSARRVLLAAGAINSARLALQSAGDTLTRLPLLENPILQIPLILPASLGRRLDTHSFGLVQLNLVWQAAAWQTLLQGSLIELTAPLRAEFFGRFPLAGRSNLALLREMLPAMLMLQLYFPAQVQPPARLGLLADSRLRIEGASFAPDLSRLQPLLGALRSLGLWTHPALIQQPVTGHAIHYAGTLPMRSHPHAYQCRPDGRLHGSERVFVADSASFSSLSAKNMSLGMMANAMRIAAGAVQ